MKDTESAKSFTLKLLITTHYSEESRRRLHVVNCPLAKKMFWLEISLYAAKSCDI